MYRKNRRASAACNLCHTFAMRIGVNSPAVPGHVNPMTVLARELQRRGHEVVFFAGFLSEPTVRAAGLSHFPFREKYFRPDNAAERFAVLSALKGRGASMCIRHDCGRQPRTN